MVFYDRVKINERKLISCYSLDKWSDDIKKNVICLVSGLKIDFDLRKRLYESCHRINEKFYIDRGIGTSFNEWPNDEPFNELYDKFYFLHDFEYVRNYIITRCLPRQIYKPHVDYSSKPTSCFYIPIYPFGRDFESVELYYDNNIITFPEIDRGDDTPVYAWNNAILHSTFNNDNVRYAIRIAFNIDYKTLINVFNFVI